MDKGYCTTLSRLSTLNFKMLGGGALAFTRQHKQTYIVIFSLSLLFLLNLSISSLMTRLNSVFKLYAEAVCALNNKYMSG